MKSLPKFLMIFLVLLFISLESIDTQLRSGQRGQRRPNRPKQRQRPRQRGKQSDDPGFYCYTCYADFERVPLSVFNPVGYIYNNPCYNPGLNYTLTDGEYLTKCSSTTKYCMVDVTRLNGVLISVDRRCGQSTCRKTCLSRGYGVIRETCTFCCGSRINEDHPDYDEEVNSVYRCPNEPH